MGRNRERLCGVVRADDNWNADLGHIMHVQLFEFETPGVAAIGSGTVKPVWIPGRRRTAGMETLVHEDVIVEEDGTASTARSRRTNSAPGAGEGGRSNK